MRTLPTAGEAGARLLRRIGRPAKTAALSAFLTGLLVYLFALTHQVFCTGDALNNYVFNGDLSWMGRWSSRWLSMPGTDYNMPQVNGLIMLAALALTAGLTASLLQVRTTLGALLVGAVMVCHPAAGATLQYLHNADGYMLAALLAVLALWLTDRHKLGFLLGAVLLCLSMGTYQAYLALVVALMAVRGAALLAEGREEDRALLGRILRYGLLAALGIALYYGVTKGLAAMGMQLSDYQSVGSMGQFTAAQLAENFLGCFRDFKESITFLSFRPGYYVNGYLNYALFAAGWGMIWFFTLRNGFRKGFSGWLRLSLLLVLTLLSPMLFCAIRMANPQYVHKLMTYSTVAVYLLAIVCCEQAEATLRPAPGCSPEQQGPAMALPAVLSQWLRRLYTWFAPAALAVCLLVWSVGSNLDFYRGHEDYQNLYAQCSAYLSLAEQTEGYEKHMPIYVVGQPDEESALSRQQPGLHEIKSYYAFMVHVLKVQMPLGAANQIDEAALALCSTEAFAAMPAYPLSGCAMVIDDAMVIKLGAVE